MNRTNLQTVALWSLMLAFGCSYGSDLSSPGAGEFGATQGGVQDMSLAREYVDRGTIPPPEAFLVEAMFSEHDLPLTGTPCSTLLCLRGAAGLAPTLDGESAAWLQIGMSSTIDPDRFERPAQNLVFTIDVSCSMGWDYEDAQSTPGELTRLMLTAIAAKLGPDDEVAIVTFGSRVRTRLSWTAGNASNVQREIEQLDEAGSTHMEAGLRRAFELAEEKAAEGPTRVMLFTDVRPNVGATSASDFEQMVAQAARVGVGTTVFGTGVGLGAETFEAMSHLRGGNAFTLFDAEDVESLMADSWPWMVSPIAYDLSLQADVGAGYTLAKAFGFPSAQSAGFEVATVFLSRRKGALLVQFVPDSPAPALSVSTSLSYQTLEGATMADQIDVSLDSDAALDERGQYFEQPSVAKTVALAVAVEGMREAATIYGSDPEGATEVAKAVVDRLTADAEAQQDAGLAAEVDFANALYDLIAGGAPQDDLYGG